MIRTACTHLRSTFRPHTPLFSPKTAAWRARSHSLNPFVSLCTSSIRPSSLPLRLPRISPSQTGPFSRQNPFFTPRSYTTASPISSSRPIVGYWLLFNAGSTFGIVVLGGLTRLTESGLSITEWNLIKGMKPPRSEEEWEVEFEKYKQFPEYKILNHQMTLPEFKSIFYMEWAHRMWGRFIGISFLLPAVYFTYKGYMTPAITRRAWGLGALIGFQGVLGWYMVKSGLKEELMTTPGAVPRVSPYRLAAHLGTAFVIYAGSIMTGLKVLRDWKIAQGTFPAGVTTALQNPRLAVFRRSAIGTAFLVFATAISGAFVAGLDAGLIYNEFPYMGGRLIPDDLWTKDFAREDALGMLRNIFENPTTAQFDHRVLAISTFSVISSLWLYSRRLPLPPGARLAVNSLMGVALLQVSLGIGTLLLMVPTDLAAAHQAGSLTLLTTALWLTHAMKRIPK
ncbi:uncharacterized protein VTP21DRAFT_5045 [Calcarisporiella thermophila]|uniref:uncharacterized protein n=1 Tax=Calcarisporiella thermophila TaxID=911321 RepID=UPI003742526C